MSVKTKQRQENAKKKSSPPKWRALKNQKIEAHAKRASNLDQNVKVVLTTPPNWSAPEGPSSEIPKMAGVMVMLSVTGME